MGAPSVPASSGGECVLTSRGDVWTIRTGTVDMNHGETCRAGAFSELACVAVSEGTACVQQSIAASELMQGWVSASHEAICEPCIGIGDVCIIAPGIHVSTADTPTAAMTQSATIPARRVRIKSIVNRPRSLLSTCLDAVFRCRVPPLSSRPEPCVIAVGLSLGLSAHRPKEAFEGPTWRHDAYSSQERLFQ